MATNTGTQRPGLACPHCGGTQLKVIYTRSRHGAKVVRRRECRQCQTRLTTWERAVPIANPAPPESPTP